jgi:ribonuclease G
MDTFDKTPTGEGSSAPSEAAVPHETSTPLAEQAAEAREHQEEMAIEREIERREAITTEASSAEEIESHDEIPQEETSDDPTLQGPLEPRDDDPRQELELEPPDRKELPDRRQRGAPGHERHQQFRSAHHAQPGRHGGGRDSRSNDHRYGEMRPSDSRTRMRPPEKPAKKEILVNCSPEESRVAVVENNHLIELLIERSEDEKIVGNIYKGRVENVLPGISSAFVNVGLEKNAYLYVSDVLPTGKHAHSSQIEKMIQRNDVIMLQVAKEAIGTKGVKVTMDISLPGRFLVYMPRAEHLGVSKNIEDRKERDRLRTIVESCAPETGGVIIRTEADGADEQALRREMAYLTRLWENVQKRFESSPTPSLVHRDLGLVFQTVRDVFTENVSIFLVDSRNEHKDLMEFLDSISPELKERVKLYEGKTPLFQAFNIESQIEKIRSARVDLPSGGYIIIQEAEGLCAIDVNTGKFTGKRSQEETVTATNVEAALEVARQLRLRNIGGIVVIDFIDMRHARNRQKVMEALAHYVRDDRAKIKILPITRLGLVEMTRERKRESLFALLGEECPQCHASGRVYSRDSMYIKLKREILTITHGRSGDTIKLFLSPPVAHYFQERQQRLENALKHKLVITPDANLPWEEYRILIE